MERDPRRDALRAELPAEAEPVPAAGAPVRGLPVPERLHADVAPRRQAAGAGVDPRRRLHPGRRPQLRRHQARGGRHRGRHDQLPARRARLPGAPGACLAARRSGRQLRLDGPAGGAALGQAQHRAVRRRPAQRDDRRPVGRRRVGARPTRIDRRARALPAGDRAERCVRTEPGAARRRRGLRHDVRRPGGLPGSDGGVPAPRAGRHPRQHVPGRCHPRRRRRQGPDRVDRDGAGRRAFRPRADPQRGQPE